MPEELEKLLSENLEISRESLKILKGIRRANRLVSAFKIFYWLVIIGSAIGAYYFLEPYIKQGLTVVSQVQEVVSGGPQKAEWDKERKPDSVWYFAKSFSGFAKKAARCFKYQVGICPKSAAVAHVVERISEKDEVVSATLTRGTIISECEIFDIPQPASLYKKNRAPPRRGSVSIFPERRKTCPSKL